MCISWQVDLKRCKMFLLSWLVMVSCVILCDDSHRSSCFYDEAETVETGLGFQKVENCRVMTNWNSSWHDLHSNAEAGCQFNRVDTEDSWSAQHRVAEKFMFALGLFFFPRSVAKGSSLYTFVVGGLGVGPVFASRVSSRRLCSVVSSELSSEFRAYGKSCKRRHSCMFQRWRCLISRGRHGTLWHAGSPRRK